MLPRWTFDATDVGHRSGQDGESFGSIAFCWGRFEQEERQARVVMVTDVRNELRPRTERIF